MSADYSGNENVEQYFLSFHSGLALLTELFPPTLPSMIALEAQLISAIYAYIIKYQFLFLAKSLHCHFLGGQQMNIKHIDASFSGHEVLWIM